MGHDEDRFEVVIETPTGSRNKLKYDEERDRFRLSNANWSVAVQREDARPRPSGQD
jgi:hypothetical protein